uniref:Thioredoxin domain-containing protein n=1 Tax=Glossina morsitans morsitans TaxID=37546 RepID=A0A1B0FKK1_GLOMM
MVYILKEALVQAPGKSIDEELYHLDNLRADNRVVMRKRGIEYMRELNKKKQKWLKNGHGTYSQLADEKEFFEISEKGPDIACHFYRDGTERCRVVDNHLNVLAGKHIKAKFFIPTIVVIRKGKTKDFIVGFADLGDLMTPPAIKRKFLDNRAQKNMRGGYEPGDSGTESDD